MIGDTRRPTLRAEGIWSNHLHRSSSLLKLWVQVNVLFSFELVTQPSQKNIQSTPTKQDCLARSSFLNFWRAPLSIFLYGISPGLFSRTPKIKNHQGFLCLFSWILSLFILVSSTTWWFERIYITDVAGLRRPKLTDKGFCFSQMDSVAFTPTAFLLT